MILQAKFSTINVCIRISSGPNRSDRGTISGQLSPPETMSGEICGAGDLTRGRAFGDGSPSESKEADFRTTLTR
ncbi:hypothetical protein NPIL_453671 [Nephila pilipes]|uniref:Uncharacterized protein n=1 Tax=Nephila pilipes TaxID=299642 RepID=A0A8X6NYS3_NEPPI|nr:hypothetical protein NPIL_453671 [Nephila pilipes]